MAPDADPYQLPNGTLRNKFGVADAEALSRFEAKATAGRIFLLNKHRLLKPPFTFDVLKQAHAYIYQDLYDWAGQVRTCPLGKRLIDLPMSPATMFTPPGRIEAEAQRIFAELADKGYLIGLPIEAFADGIADLFVAINNLHAFREGNGRSQREYLRALARNAGHELPFDVVTRERMVSVSISGSRNDPAPTRRLFRELTDPGRVQAMRKAIAFLDGTGKVSWNDLYVATCEDGQSYRGRVVSSAGPDVMVRVNDPARPDWILIGNVDDLPPNAQSGAVVTFTARAKKT